MPCKVSVIIPVFNAEKTIEECVETMLRQEVPFEFEVIVVNDGSTDGTPELLKKYTDRISVLHQENSGPAAARNRGARAARGEVLVFCDSDCSFAESFLKQMAMPITRGELKKIVGVQGRYKTRQASAIARLCQLEIEERYTIYRKHEFISMIGTYAAAYKRSVFCDMGMFDTRFPTASGEDAALSFAMIGRGHKLVFNPKAVCYHAHPADIRSYYRQKFGRAYWRNLLYKMHPGKMVDDDYTPHILKFQTALSLYCYLHPAVCIALIATGIPVIAVIGMTVTGAAIYLSSMIPLAVRVFRRDRPLTGYVPLYSLVRSFALANGLAAGFIDIHIKKGTLK